MYPIINYFAYGNYNVPYYNAVDQCIRLSPKMASFAAENTQDSMFLLLRSKDTFMEFRIEGNKSREYSWKKVDIEVLKATNCYLKS